MLGLRVLLWQNDGLEEKALFPQYLVHGNDGPTGQTDFFVDSLLEEILIHASALVHPPTLQHRSVSSLHPHAAMERSLPPMSPVLEPGRRSVGEVPLPPRMQTLLVQRLQAYLQ